MLVSASSSIKFWDKDKFTQIQDVSAGSGSISDLTWNNDGQFLAALNGKNSEVSLYTVNAKTCIQSRIIKVMDDVKSIQFGNATNRFMAVAGSSQSIIIWDVNKNSKMKSFHIPSGRISKVSFNYLDTHLVAGTELGEAYVMSNTTNVISTAIKFPRKTKVTGMQYSSLHRSLIGGCGEDGTVVFADANVSKVVKAFANAHSAPATSVVFSPFNELLMISVGYDKKLICYNARSKSQVVSFESSAALTSAAFLDSRVMAVGTISGDILVYDTKMLSSPLSVIHAYKSPVLDVKSQPTKNGSSVRGSISKLSNSTRSSQPKLRRETKPQTVESNNLSAKSEPVSSGVKPPVGSPSLELLSPVQSSAGQGSDVKINENCSLLSNNSFNSQHSGLNLLDDKGLLSPLDKENASPSSQKYSGSTKRHSSRFSIGDGILSPLQTNSSLNSQGEVLSPLVRFSLSGDVSTSSVSDKAEISGICAKEVEQNGTNSPAIILEESVQDTVKEAKVDHNVLSSSKHASNSPLNKVEELKKLKAKYMDSNISYDTVNTNPRLVYSISCIDDSNTSIIDSKSSYEHSYSKVVDSGVKSYSNSSSLDSISKVKDSDVKSDSKSSFVNSESRIVESDVKSDSNSRFENSKLERDDSNAKIVDSHSININVESDLQPRKITEFEKSTDGGHSLVNQNITSLKGQIDQVSKFSELEISTVSGHTSLNQNGSSSNVQKDLVHKFSQLNRNSSTRGICSSFSAVSDYRNLNGHEFPHSNLNGHGLPHSSLTEGDVSGEGLSDCVAIAFPPDDAKPEDQSYEVLKLQNDLKEGSLSLDPTVMSVNLVKNCVEDAVERYAFDLNRRMMHMHSSMIKEFYFMKVEMRELIKKNSINEELLKEIERLRREVKDLRSNY